jgi:hypothetical protein
LLRDSGPTRYFQGVHKKMAKTKKLAKVKKLEKTVTLKYGRNVLLSSVDGIRGESTDLQHKQV